MPRPYTDPVEIITEPVPATSPFIPTDAKIAVGAVAPASPDPIPIVLLPGFEYRMREWRHPGTHEVHWRLERRRSGQRGDNDDCGARRELPGQDPLTAPRERPVRLRTGRALACFARRPVVRSWRA